MTARTIDVAAHRVERSATRASGVGALGGIGKTSEQVAEETVQLLMQHWRSGAAFDLHLGDQTLSALSFSGGTSMFSVERVTSHLRTNAWVIEQFGLAETRFEAMSGGVPVVTVTPRAARESFASAFEPR